MHDARSSYTTTEAAPLLGLAPRTVTRYIERGLIKATKRGRDWHIDAVDLARYQQARRAESESSFL